MIEHRHPHRERPSNTGLSSDHAYLTEDGRRLLEDRVHLLEATVGELRDALDDPEYRADSVEGFHRASAELARLRALLDRSARPDGR
jgi:hypothetical protein